MRSGRSTTVLSVTPRATVSITLTSNNNGVINTKNISYTKNRLNKIVAILILCNLDNRKCKCSFYLS
jgi:hypothetical protein